MKEILSDFLIWLTLLAVLTFLLFLFRGLKTIRWRTFARLFISFSCLCAALILFPRGISLTFIQFFASLIVIAAAITMVIDILLGSILKIKGKIFKTREPAIPLPEYLMEICRAIQTLASQRIGALIVLEGKEKLLEQVHGGLPFDAQIKAEVLVALFSKASPVHDGAVIVAGSRIRKVKVIFPLRTDAQLPMGIGTRHRSAVSITEKTEAIALIASEERGEISIAFRGRLVKIDSQTDLYRLIKTALKGKNIASEEPG